MEQITGLRDYLLKRTGLMHGEVGIRGSVPAQATDSYLYHVLFAGCW